MKKTKFSIITPCYNRQDTIVRCINSVSNQKYKNYEHIITDDGSTDKTVKIIKENLNKDIKLFKFNKNKGIAAARNKCLDNITGNWIIFLDSDDELTPGILGKLAILIESDEKNKNRLDGYMGLSKVYYQGKLIHEGKFLINKEIINFEDLIAKKIISYEGGGCNRASNYKNWRYDERLCKYGNESLFHIDFNKNKRYRLINEYLKILHLDSGTNTRKTINKEKMSLAGEANEIIAKKAYPLYKKNKKKIGKYWFFSGFNYCIAGHYKHGIKNMLISFKYNLSLKRILYFLLTLLGSRVLTFFYKAKEKYFYGKWMIQ